MGVIVHHILLVIVAAILFLAISVSWWIISGNPQARAMLEGIIPSLIQAEKLSMEQGFKALHVKMTPEGGDETINEFHPTNEGALGRKHLSRLAEVIGSDIYTYFFLKKFETDKCYVFTTKYNSWIYRVSPGSKILQTSQKLISDLIIEKESCEPQGGCKDMKPGEFTVCRDTLGINLDFWRWAASCADNDEEKLKTYNFGIPVLDKCVENEEPCPYINGKRDCCAFSKLEGNRHVYKPAYSIICGFEQVSGGGSSEARWYACTDQQYATVSTEPSGSGTQFTCDKGEWVVKSGSGVHMLNPQIRYESGIFVIDKTNLEFVVANNQDKDIANVKVSAKVADPQGSVDCRGNTPYANSIEKTTSVIAKNGGAFKYFHDNFCYKAKTFDVKVEYTGGTKNYKIECPNANLNNKDWQKCSSEITGTSYGLGANIFSGKCDSKLYDVDYLFAGITSIRVQVKEDGQIIKEGPNPTIEIMIGETKTINNLKITVYSLDTTTNMASIAAECV